jgi:hypothetical protein
MDVATELASSPEERSAMQLELLPDPPDKDEQLATGS